MALPTREGTYRASVTAAALSIHKDKPQFAVTVAMEEWYSDTDAQWYSVAAEQTEITGYFFLINNDGAVNTINRDQIVNVFGWDGVDIGTLAAACADDRWVGSTIQVWLRNEEYKGKTSIRVGGLRLPDADPTRSLKSATPAEVSAMASRFNSMLRATAPKVAAPAKPAPPPPPPAAPRIPTASQMERAGVPPPPPDGIPF